MPERHEARKESSRASGPFIIETRHLTPDGLGVTRPNSRRAVATLEEGCAPYALPANGRDESMQERVDRGTTYDYIRLWDEGAQPLSLSDGTVIHIRAVQWRTLCDLTGERYPGGAEDRLRIVFVFNSQQVSA